MSNPIIDLILRLPLSTKRQLLATLQKVPEGQVQALDALFKASLAEILKLEAASIDLSRCALDYGMDSISFMQWLSRWQKQQGVDLRPIDAQLHEPLASWLERISALSAAVQDGRAAPRDADGGQGAGPWQEILWQPRTPALALAPASDQPPLGLLAELLSEGVAVRAAPLHPGGLQLRLAQALPERARQLLAGNETRLLEVVGDREWYPAFPVQRRYWLLAEMSGEPALYTNIIGLALHGPLDPELLRGLCLQLLQSEKALRVTLQRVGQHVVQQVLAAEQAFDFAVVDLQPAGTQAPQRMRDILRREAAIDKQRGPCVKFRLFQTAPELAHFYVLVDHVVSDAFALIRLMQLLLDGLAHQGRLQLPASWRQRSYLDKALLPLPAASEASRQFWLDHLQDAPYNTRLPVDAAGAADASQAPYAGGVARVDLPGLARLRAFASQHKLTLFKLVSALLLRLLQDWSGESDLVVGFPVQRRTDAADQEMVGDYTNTVPLRVRMPAAGEWQRLLEDVSTRLDQVLQHANLPFEQIATLRPRRMEFENPLFNIMFNEQPSYGELNRQIGPLRAELLDDPSLTGLAKMAMMFIWSQNDDGLTLFCEYRTRQVSAESVQRLLARLPVLVQECMGDNAKPLASNTQAATRLCLAATFSIEPLEKALREWLGFFSWTQDIACADYNQVFQELVNPKSLLAGNHDGVNLIVIRRQDVGEHGGELLRLLQNFLNRQRTPLILMLAPDSGATPVEPEAAHAWRGGFVETLAPFQHACVIDWEEIDRLYPVAVRDDPHRYQLGKIPYTDPYYQALAASATRAMFGLRYKKPKVVVLDCDNTLWQGVVGEDGLAGIRVSPASVALQQRMIALQQAGILLCLCSKNMEADVLQVLDEHPAMRLRREHLVGWKINWLPKSENIAQLARELELGEDSFVFIDDNPVEISEVQAACPAVTCLLLPREEADIERFVAHHWLLDVPRRMTGEDAKRTRMYQENLQRTQLLQHADGFQEFLDQLQLDIRIEPMLPEQLERVAQLMVRTNQFNTSTRRRSASEIEAYEAGGGQVRTVTVQDRFGDYGLVGVVLYRLLDDACEIDDFLMSCRVLGRGVEHRIIAYAASQALQHGKSQLAIAYRATAKNQPVRQLILQDLLPEQTVQAQDGFERMLFGASRLAELRYVPQQAHAGEEQGGKARAQQREYDAPLLERLGAVQQAGAEFLTRALLPRRIEAELRQRLDQWLHRIAPAKTLRFEATDLQRFAEVSRDYNPLHTQPEYAAETAFGRPVVFGVLGALSALQEHAQLFARHAQWELHIQFHNALLPGMNYQVQAVAPGGEAAAFALALDIRDGAKLMTSIRVQALAADAARALAAAGPLDGPAGAARREAADPDPASFDTVVHGSLPELQDTLEKDGGAGAWPMVRRALMACSYAVGMERPGRQALFSALRLRLDGSRGHAGPLAFRLDPADHEPGFGLLQYRAAFACAGRIVAQAELKAFRRSVLPNWRAELPPASQALQGKRAFVSGGTRGLGAALVLQLARAGCEVWALGRHNAAALQALQQQVPGRIHAVLGDMARDWPRIWQQLQAQTQGAGLDFMILNAAPAALELYPGDSNRGQIAAYVEQCLACMQPAAASFAAAGRGKLVYVSSLFAANDGASETAFFPYVLAKQLAEQYLHALAQYHDEADVLIVRPDRIATGMANKSNYALANTLAPHAVASAVADLLHGPGRGVRIEHIAGPQAAAAAVQAAPPAALTDSSGDVEARLRPIWCQALERADADPACDFFAQGGTSMNLVELIAAIRKQFGIRLDYVDLPREITLGSLGALLRAKGGQAAAPAAADLAASVASRPLPPARPAAADPIAIVGIDARFPGCEDLRQFWPLIGEQRKLIQELPETRRALFARRLALTPGRRYFGSFLPDIERFDAEFFQIAASDAQAMPPHLRLLLQCAWNCFQEAGFAPGQGEMSRTGVFMACNTDAYSGMLADSLSGELPPFEFASRLQGMTPNFVANSLSHQLDLSGPSEVVNTTCSSFLVALHRACTSLQAGECEQALVGAASLLIDPLNFIALEKLGLLSSDGQVQSFQPAASGTTLGEGVGAVLLMPLSRARQLGAHVHAVLAATASGHGGRGASPVAPNAATQAALLHSLCERAQCAPRDLDYIELHGMGHEFADSSELRGLAETFAVAPEPGKPTLLSSLKPHLGHLMEASGLAALLKVIAALKNETLPAMPGTPATPPELLERGLQFSASQQAWELRGTVRQAAINSFGLTAVYGAAVLRAAPEMSVHQMAAPVFEQGLALPVSAHDAEGLRAVLQRLLDWLPTQDAASLGSLACTLQHGRSPLAFRTVLLVRDWQEVQGVLSGCVQETQLAGRVFGHGTASPALRAWLDGAPMDWEAAYPGLKHAGRISLPAYPFAGRSWWIDGKRQRQQRVLSQFMRREIGLAQARAELLSLLDIPRAAPHLEHDLEAS